MANKSWLVVIIALVASYQVYQGISYFYEKRKTESQWSQADRLSLMSSCIRDVGENRFLFPKITQDYCDCANDLTMSKFTKPEYMKLIDRPMDEQVLEISPLIENCLAKYEDELKSKRTEEWTDSDYALLVESCMQKSKESALSHPQLTKDYCECSCTKMIGEFDKEEIVQLQYLNRTYQDSTSAKLFKACTEEFKRGVELQEK